MTKITGEYHPVLPTHVLFLQDGANIVKKMKGVFCFRVKNVEGKEGIWIVDAKNGTGSVSYGGPGMN